MQALIAGIALHTYRQPCGWEFPGFESHLDRTPESRWRLAPVITPMRTVLSSCSGSKAMIPSPDKITVLKNGRVIDPATGFDGIANVVVKGGKIAEVAT